MKNGFMIKWKKYGQKEWQNEFASENITEVGRKEQELKTKGYKVSELIQCLF